MGFLSYNMEYFRRELDALEIGPPTTEKVYHAQQLYRILEDLAAEGYHQLNELLETEKCGSSRLQAYLSRNNAAPFPMPHPGPDEKELSYAEREVELAAAIRDAIKSASDQEPGERTPFLRELKGFCRWIGYEPDTAYIFLLRDTLLPFAYYQARERRRIYPWLLSRKAFAKLAGREAGDDSLRAAVYRGLEAGNGTDFAQMRKHVLPDMVQNLRQYPKVEARLRAMLAGIPEKRILVIESGCAGTFPLLLMSLDARVDMRMYTTYPYLVDAYGSRIYTRRYEENRLFETLTAQENLFVFSDWREDGFYVRPCLNVEIRRQALRELRQMQVE